MSQEQQPIKNEQTTNIVERRKCKWTSKSETKRSRTEEKNNEKNNYINHREVLVDLLNVKKLKKRIKILTIN